MDLLLLELLLELLFVLLLLLLLYVLINYVIRWPSSARAIGVLENHYRAKL